MIAMTIISIILSLASGVVWYLSPSHVKIMPALLAIFFWLLAILFYLFIGK